MLNELKLTLKSNYFLLKAIRLFLANIGFYKRKATSTLDIFWQERVNLVVLSPDNLFIERVSNAGEIVQDFQVMHNGIRIHVGSYYGDGNTVLLHKNRGVHEPQEERIFNDVIKLLPLDAVMLELGSFWGFYSMSFQQKIKWGKNYLIEPDPHALLSGKHNFKLNKFSGNFFNYFVSDKPATGSIPSISVDQFLTDQKIEHLHLLHSDIQGFEFLMLSGAINYLKAAKIDYIFISTHSNELHEACKEFLEKLEYKILCDADLNETYSWDGLVVAKHKNIPGPDRFDISKK
jgi:hypothetical protein